MSVRGRHMLRRDGAAQDGVAGQTSGSGCP